MTDVFSTVPTPWLLAAEQAFAAGGPAINLGAGTLKVGDGNGAVPTASAIVANGGVLHQVWQGPVNGGGVDPANALQINVNCLIPTVDSSGAEIGPFTVREFAIYDVGGNLALVGTTNLPKTVSSGGQLTTLQWWACYAAAVANSVIVQPPAGSFPTLGQIQAGVAGLLSGASPISIAAAPQPSGWTDWTVKFSPGVFVLTSPSTVTPSQAFGLIALEGASSFTTTLAAAASVAGKRFTFFNHSATYMTIVTGAGDQIFAGTWVSSITLGAGETLDIVSEGDCWVQTSVGPGSLGAGLISASAPIDATPTLQPSGLTTWNIDIAPSAIILHGTDAGTGTAVAVATVTPAATSFGRGQLFLITKSPTPISGPATATILGITGALIWEDGNALASNEWAASAPALLLWDGAVFRLLSVMGPSVYQRVGALAAAVKALPAFSASVSNGSQPLAGGVVYTFNSGFTTGPSTFATSSFASGAFTVGAGEGGLYVFAGSFQLATNADNIFTAIVKNGSLSLAFGQQFGTTNIFQNVNVVGFGRLAVGDVLTMQVQQQNVGNAIITATQVYLNVVRIGN